MRADTQTVTIPVQAAEVFRFLADPANLPKWAVGFCHTIRPDADGEHWLAQTAQGEVRVRYRTDPATGVIDYHLAPAPGVELVAHSRVVPNGEGAEYVFTQFQAPGTPDAVFESQVEALREELVVLRALLKARAACPA